MVATQDLQTTKATRHLETEALPRLRFGYTVAEELPRSNVGLTSDEYFALARCCDVEMPSVEIEEILDQYPRLRIMSQSFLQDHADE